MILKSQFKVKLVNFHLKLKLCRRGRNKNKHFEKLEEHINNQQNEISNYHKVSFVKQLDKQLEEQKKITEVHKLRLKCKKLIKLCENKISNLKKEFVN